MNRPHTDEKCPVMYFCKIQYGPYVLHPRISNLAATASACVTQKLLWHKGNVKGERTRSRWLNCALRDDEAVYLVSIGHYEAVAVGN